MHQFHHSFKIFIFIFLTSGCSFNKNSKFWTASQNIPEESNPNYQEIFAEEEALNKELNANVSISLGDIFNNNSNSGILARLLKNMID
ncbi:MAG: hypothetical protein EBW64_05470 [Betaproteobacteria bacterium]|nr:hypothetical protein [Betaproteobacteria bacterium]